MGLLGLFEKNLAWAAIFGSFVADTTGRPSTGPEWAFVHTLLNRRGRKKTVSCERGHLSHMLRGPPGHLVVLKRRLKVVHTILS